MQAFHRSRRLCAFYLELAGDSECSEQLAAKTRSQMCYFWSSDNAFSTGDFGQFCIAVCRVLSAVSLRARTGVLASSFVLEAGGFDSPLTYPSGPD